MECWEEPISFLGEMFSLSSVIIVMTLAIFQFADPFFFCLVPNSSALFLPDFGNQLLFVFHWGAAFPCTNPVQNWFSEKEQLLLFWWKTLSQLWTKQWPSVPGCCGLLWCPGAQVPGDVGHLASRHSCFLCFLSLLGVKLRTKLHGKLH